MKIGIPTGFLYQRKKVLWKSFFKSLNIEIILSENSNNQVLSEGKKYASNEDCLPYKLYLGQIASLLNKCDKILIPRVDYLTKEDNICAKYQGIYDVANTIFNNTSFLDYNIDILNNKNEKDELLRIGKKLGKTKEETLKAYEKALNDEQKEEMELFLLQEQKLKSEKTKILIVAHDYELEDLWISNKIIKILNDLNVEIIDANKYPKSKALEIANEDNKTLPWLMQKELLGSYKYYLPKVDGVLFISSFPCGCDSLFFEKLLRNTKKPAINLVIDEQIESGGIETRLESFIDIIKEKIK